MRVKIFRFDPCIDKEGYFQGFSVPFSQDDHWTVMDVLDYISINFDSSLAYFKHSACDHGICGRCALKVNGQVKLACTCTINKDEELIIEPKNDSSIIRDLVID